MKVPVISEKVLVTPVVQDMLGYSIQSEKQVCKTPTTEERSFGGFEGNYLLHLGASKPSCIVSSPTTWTLYHSESNIVRNPL